MKNLLPALLLLLTLFGCNKSGSIHCYKIKDSNRTAIIQDSTISVMCGLDTVFIYDLKKIRQFVGDDGKTYKVYNLKFINSAVRIGYGLIDCPLKMKVQNLMGGLPVALVQDNESINLGGYNFTRDTSRVTLLRLLDLIASAERNSK